MKIDILAIGVHPDDIELSCSGTLLKHKAMGNTIALCDLTQGELGTRGNAELRLLEAEKARQLMGAEFRINLGMADGFFQINEENYMKIIEVIRYCRPEIVLANALADRHPDHGRAAQLVKEACFLAGLSKIQTKDSHGHNQEAWRPKHVFHYIQDRNIPADFVIDITAFIELKMKLIGCFSSQFFNPASEEPETPISSKYFMEHMKAKNIWYARDINTGYAEAFQCEKNIGIKSLFDLQ